MNTFKINPALNTQRKEYEKGALTEESILDNPFHQFEAWLSEAFDSGNEYANAMVLSTVGANNMPASRVVLLRNISYGGFTFYTNYHSKKARDLEQNNKASLLFFWPDMERQVRVEGEIKFMPRGESDAYFESRPFESKVAASISQQSNVIFGRGEMEMLFEEELKKYPDKKVPRPAHWGGYVLLPATFEFWQGRANRLHDRIVYRGLKRNEWVIERLMP